MKDTEKNVSAETFVPEEHAASALWSIREGSVGVEVFGLSSLFFALIRLASPCRSCLEDERWVQNFSFMPIFIPELSGVELHLLSFCLWTFLFRTSDGHLAGDATLPDLTWMSDEQEMMCLRPDWNT